MWKKLPEPTKEELAAFRQEKKAQIYADEDIEEDVVDWLRSRGVNVKSARELGHRGKPDSFHAAFALKEKRFLLTKNAKDFIDDRKLPFHKIHGVIALSSGFRDSDQYGRMLAQIFKIIPYGDNYAKSKITVSPDGLIIRRIGFDGRIEVLRFKADRTGAYAWVDD